MRVERCRRRAWVERGTKSNARQTSTNRLLDEDTCVSSISRNPRFPFSKPLHALACENAFASSPVAALHNLLLENCRIPLARRPGASRFTHRGASPCEDSPPLATQFASHPRTSEAGSSLSGARSVSECSSVLFIVKRDLKRSQKNSSTNARHAEVTSPIRLRVRPHSTIRMAIGSSFHRASSLRARRGARRLSIAPPRDLEISSTHPARD